MPPKPKRSLPDVVAHRRRVGRLMLALVSVVLLVASCGQSSDEGADDMAGSDSELNTESSNGDEISPTDATEPDDSMAASTASSQSDGGEADGDSGATTTRPATPDSDLFTSTGGDKGTITTETIPSGGSEPDYDPSLAPLVDQARTDLAERLGIDAGDITLLLAELRNWPDSSIGCPREGMQYLPQVTDGAEFVFVVAGTEYRYTMGGQVFTPRLCET